MTLAEKRQTWAIIKAIGDTYFQGRCQVTHEICTSGKGFLLHHKKYRRGELTYEDFADKTRGRMSDDRRLAYYQYLQKLMPTIPQAERNVRFAFIQNKVHGQATKLRRRKDNAILGRLFELVLETEFTSPTKRKKQ